MHRTRDDDYTFTLYELVCMSICGYAEGVSARACLGVSKDMLSYAMCHASRHGHTSVVTTLLSAGADVHHACDMAFMVANVFGHTETSDTLRAAGARTDITEVDNYIFVQALRVRMNLQ